MSSRKRNPPTRRRRRRAGRRLPSWLGPTIGIVVGVGLFSALGLFVYRTVQDRWTEIAEYLDPGNRIDLSYLPPDADFLIVVRGSALRRSGSVQAFVESAHYREGLEPAWELLGLSAENIDTATYGAVGFGRQLDHVLAGDAEAPGFITVIRTIEPVQRISATSPLVSGEEVTHGNRTYVRIHAPSAGSGLRTFAVLAESATTVVFGTEEQVQAAIDRLDQGTPPPRRTELDFVNPEHQFVIVSLADAVVESDDGGPETTSPFPASFTRFVETIDRMPDRYSLGLTFAGDDITIEALCRFENDSRQAAFVARLEEITRTAQEQLASEQSERSGGGSRRWELESAGRQTLEELRVRSGTDLVTVGTIVPINYLIERDLLRMHTLAATPFNLTLQDAPRLMLGVEQPEEED